MSKTVGVIGGMGPEATVEFLRRIVASTPARDDQDHIRVLVDNNPKIPSRLAAIVEGTGESPLPALITMAKGLEKQGADLLTMPCNTAHYYRPRIAEAVSIPFLDMIALSVAAVPGTRIGMLASPAVRKVGLYEKNLHAAGKQAVFPSDDGPVLGLTVNFVEDFEFDNGYVSPYLVTDPGSMPAVLDDPYILFTAEKVTDVRLLMPVLERIMRNPRPLVIIAEKVEGTALQMLVHNHVNGHLKVTAIQAPGFGEKRIHLLEDMAALCGGKVHSKASSFALEQIGV